MSNEQPLLWEQEAEVYRVQTDRDELLARIAKLRPHARQRIVLEHRLIEKTGLLIRLQTQLAKRKGGRYV